MYGNANEWVLDWKDDDADHSWCSEGCEDPAPREGLRPILKGGSMRTDAHDTRISNRRGSDIDGWGVSGVRCVRSPISFGETDADTDADSDADSDTDSDTDTSYCGTIHEVRQPSTDLCWRRCMLGQTWNGNSCEGTGFYTVWCDATGEEEGCCVPENPGMNACEDILGTGYRLPTKEEYMDMLGNCVGDDCDSCVESENCSDMFGLEGYTYWTSTYEGDSEAWEQNLANGVSHTIPVYNITYIRYLREI